MKIELKITEEFSRQRIDKVLSSLEEIRTRSRAEKLLHENHVLLNGMPVKPSHKTKLDEVFVIEIPPPEPSQLLPLDFKLDILYEDKDVLVVNKPSGLVVHPAAGHQQDTLVNALVSYTEDLSMGFGENRPGIVHRLDKDTSGILVVAKNDFAHESLAIQFKQKTAHRKYWALTLGKWKLTQGTYESLLARHTTDRKKFSSHKTEGKKAVTHYQVMQQASSGISLVHLKLETGRTHQIRVHLSESGHPIVGDSLYGSSKLENSLSKNLKVIISQLNRFALHAAELGFVHPTSKKELHFSVGWPENLKTLLKEAGITHGN